MSKKEDADLIAKWIIEICVHSLWTVNSARTSQSTDDRDHGIMDRLMNV